MLMDRIFYARHGQPSWLSVAIAVVLSVVLGFVFWTLLQIFIAHSVSTHPVSTSWIAPVVRRVKTIPIGPDLLAEPDPLKPYGGSP
jgi:hypothetical protein